MYQSQIYQLRFPCFIYMRHRPSSRAESFLSWSLNIHTCVPSFILEDEVLPALAPQHPHMCAIVHPRGRNPSCPGSLSLLNRTSGAGFLCFTHLRSGCPCVSIIILGLLRLSLEVLYSSPMALNDAGYLSMVLENLSSSRGLLWGKAYHQRHLLPLPANLYLPRLLLCL